MSNRIPSIILIMVIIGLIVQSLPVAAQPISPDGQYYAVELDEDRLAELHNEGGGFKWWNRDSTNVCGADYQVATYIESYSHHDGGVAQISTSCPNCNLTTVFHIGVWSDNFALGYELNHDLEDINAALLAYDPEYDQPTHTVGLDGFYSGYPVDGIFLGAWFFPVGDHREPYIDRLIGVCYVQNPSAGTVYRDIDMLSSGTLESGSLTPTLNGTTWEWDFTLSVVAPDVAPTAIGWINIHIMDENLYRTGYTNSWDVTIDSTEYEINDHFNSTTFNDLSQSHFQSGSTTIRFEGSLPVSNTSVTPTLEGINLRYAAIQVSTGNSINDGDMEQQPLSTFWFPAYDMGGSGDFGRISDLNLLTVGYGDPRCNLGWQIIGNTKRCGWSVLEFYNEVCARSFTAIRQNFNWAGGPIYWRFSARGMPDNGWARDVNIQVWITNRTTGQQTSLYTGGVPPQWTDFKGTTATLIAGLYVVNVYRGVTGNTEWDAFSFDDLVISNSPLPESACESIVPVTTATATVGAATSTTTATPIGTAGDNLIENCGFEQGRASWVLAPQSSILYDQIKASYIGHNESTSARPGIKQYFHWPGGIAYLQFQSDSAYSVYYRNAGTHQEYPAASSTNPTYNWRTWRATTYLPAGAYWLSLHHPNGAAGSNFDGVSVSAGNYSVCGAGPSYTPTPNSTPTPNHTPTMWPTWTMQATSTVPGGYATSTPPPTYTPYPTFTPPPDSTSTPRPDATQTPWYTYTPQPTYTLIPTYTMMPTYTMVPTITTLPGTETVTPYPTYTPWATYTPGIPGLVVGLPTNPPPQQPPPSYFADCQRPQNGYDMAHWLEYQKCQMLSYWSWSPNAQATYQAFGDVLSQREPGGTLKEVDGLIGDVQDMVNSYDFGQPLPGTGDAPSLDKLFGDRSFWETGELEWKTGSQPDMTCETKFTGVIGQLALGYCWIMNLLAEKGIMAWLQLMINLVSIGVLLNYIWNKWIDAGTGGA